MNDAGQNVTSLFDVNVANQTVTFNLRHADSSFMVKATDSLFLVKKRKATMYRDGEMRFQIIQQLLPIEEVSIQILYILL